MRPITILCNLYRVWSRVLVAQVLMQWSHHLPPSVTGCVKGRSSSDLAYTCSVAIEQALAKHEDLSGLSVDLSKAFNLGELLCWLGIPRQVVTFWLRCLSQVSRCFQVCSSLSASVPSSTGAPEGDPISVLGMVAVCTPDLSPHFYMDNWSWMSWRPEPHGVAVGLLRDFTGSMRMVVNWAKSYCWIVHPSSKKWLRRVLPSHLAEGVNLPVLSHVRELGVQLQFGRKVCLQHVMPKLEEAVCRLRRLFHDPSPLHAKARVIQSGIFPHAFFGSFNAAPGQVKVHRLRSHAARALLGRHHTMSPLFAAMYLVRGLMDPEVFLLWSHATALRRAFQVQPHKAAQVLAMMQQSPFTTVYGPATALRNLLDRNGWEARPDGKVKGPDHWVFDLRHSCSKSIAEAVQGGRH